ncbi:MAG: ferrous iron transport protein A, partial [Firmicutes bacterium]|nr:ferrous iron transport protein A [Bacillota bacterium]
DLGLIPGAAVECVGRAPLGDPAAYLIAGAVIAIRRRDAESVLREGERREDL